MKQKKLKKLLDEYNKKKRRRNKNTKRIKKVLSMKNRDRIYKTRRLVYFKFVLPKQKIIIKELIYI